eukprot:scaffold63499_cov63-Phaeocystis_antarctica.AAC.6
MTCTWAARLYSITLFSSTPSSRSGWSNAVKWATLEATGSSTVRILGIGPRPGSFELPRATRHTPRRYRSQKLGHCQGGTLTMLRGSSSSP